MLRKIGHEMPGDIFYARASAKVHAHQRTENLAILVTGRFASETECGIDNFA
jgi:hypothetical protein